MTTTTIHLSRAEKQTLYTLAELPNHLPEVDGQKVTRQKLWRWYTVGIARRSDGVRVKLNAIWHGGRLASSVADVEAFQAELGRTTLPEMLTRTEQAEQDARDRADHDAVMAKLRSPKKKKGK